jgi:glycosyltransferase involved in cell wall biosynthesis
MLAGMPGFESETFFLTERPSKVGALRGAARLRGEIPDHDLIHVHGDSSALVCLKLLGRRPTVITLHGSHLLRRSGGLQGRAVRAGLRRAFGRAARVIAVSESELELARSLRVGSVRLVLNGVPERKAVSAGERRSAREGLGLDEDAIAVLFAGELSERKQPLQLAEALRRAHEADPRIVGIFAGDGPLSGALDSLAGEAVRPLGSRDDVDALLAAADIFALPSLWEGLPYAVLEALAAGVPVLASDGPGNPDAVGEAGALFPAGDVEAMTNALLGLTKSPELRESLGEAGAARARERFSLDRMVEQTAAVYEEALRVR